MSFLTTVANSMFDGYLTLLAYLFTLFLEYLVFTTIFKHEETPQGEIIKLRWSQDEKNLSTRIKIWNLVIFVLLVPFTIHPLISVMEKILANTGWYILPLTFLAGALGYLAATKEHIEHKWKREDTLVLAGGIAIAIIFILLILRFGL